MASRTLPSINAALPASPRWASKPETAIYIRGSVKTVQRMLDSGKLTGYRLGDRMLRIDLNEVDALMQPVPASGRTS